MTTCEKMYYERITALLKSAELKERWERKMNVPARQFAETHDEEIEELSYIILIALHVLEDAKTPLNSCAPL